ncbi:MAG: relaxase/mobilization nuclease domain-containing protein [Oscillospiraceae bacterium]|nr:relaxase/mobilization nuclease domain-containing protein [Oscillospiraceae bacterium]
MAVTTLHSIKTTLIRAVKYITNPDKTDGKLLVSSHGCSAETAHFEFDFTRKNADKQGGVLAYHLIQAFKPDEVDYSTAHEIGIEFADKILRGKYEYVIATHTDKDHCHNHIIFNSVSFKDRKKYHSPANNIYRIRRVSDMICSRRGLSIIEKPSGNKGKSHYEWQKEKEGQSWKSKLRETIDRNILQAQSWDEFLSLMQAENYQIKYGKYISFKANNQERFTRAKTLGVEYSEDRIRERIKGISKITSNILNRNDEQISLMIDIENHIKCRQSKGFENWAKLNNLKTAAKTFNFLSENGIKTYEDLAAKYDEARNQKDVSQEKIRTVEKRIKEIDVIIKDIEIYRKTKPIVERLDNVVFKAQYRKENEAEFILFTAADKALRKHFKDGKLPLIKTLRAEQREIYENKNHLYAERNNCRDAYHEIKKMKANIDLILGKNLESEIGNRRIKLSEIE